MNKTATIYYHFEDNDGVCSAAIMKYYLMTELGYSDSDIHLEGVNYNMLGEIAMYDDEFPQSFAGFGNQIIMTDISFSNAEHMKAVVDTFGSRFTWVDHHAPIIKESERLGFDTVNGLRDTHHSAIVNMWKHLYDPFNMQKIPSILAALSGWDSWSWQQYGLEFEYVRRVNVGFTSASELNIEWWLKNMKDILEDGDAAKKLLTEMYLRGSEICNADDRKNEKMCKTVGDITWTVDNNRKAIMVVLYGGSNSIMFKSMRGVVDNALVFRRTKEGNWSFSMYNVNDNDTFNCGTYLKEHYGGGGHGGAAGATVTQDAFIEMLKNKAV